MNSVAQVSTRHPGSMARRSGFTLAEVIVVMVILAIVVGVTAPSLVGSLNRFRMDEAASNLLMLMRYTRQKAVVVQETRRIFIDIDRNSYWMEEVVRDRRGRVEDTVKRHLMVLPEHHHIRAVYRPLTEETHRNDVVEIAFFPDGTCDGAYVLIERPAGRETSGAQSGLKVEPYNSNPKYMTPEEMDEFFAGY